MVVELYEKLAIKIGATSDFTNLFIPGDNETEVMRNRGKRFNEAKLEFNNYLVLNKLFIEEKLFEELFAQERSIHMLCKQYEDFFSKLGCRGLRKKKDLNYKIN